MRRGLLFAGLAAVLSFGVGTAFSAPSTHVKTARAKKIARTAQVESGIRIVSGVPRTIPGPAGGPEDVGDAIAKADVFTTDTVDLACPDGMVAIGGGFSAPDDAVVQLIGSSPSPGVVGAWRLQASVEWPEGDDTTWTPYVSCAR